MNKEQKMNTEQEMARFEAWHERLYGRRPVRSSKYGAYQATTHCERWLVWKARAALQSQDRKPCTWEHDAEIDAYETTCGNTFIVGEGTPAENDMKFCCYCGGALIEAIDHARRIEGEEE